MKAQYINAIHPDFDTSLQLDLSIPETIAPEVVEERHTKIIRLPTIKRKESETTYNEESERVSGNSLGVTINRKETTSFEFTSSSDPSSFDLNKPIRKKLRLRDNESEKPKKKLKLPQYSPPPFFSSFYQHVNDSWINGNYSTTPKYISKRPRVPKCKTNTNMATYVHRLYVYEQFMKLKGDSSDSSIN
ncbi:hypothetical protein CLIB1423_02S01662 [[Candida] railenensis]|uniref:Uncharacterized protein n=1 Tax=[Candida] railenensis TaxID=45579 RepID=A0A9P0QK76_9ASCO|nr:hypothetical protein CLIB1423_02S01662 [[Candida] railenensis]